MSLHAVEFLPRHSPLLAPFPPSSAQNNSQLDPLSVCSILVKHPSLMKSKHPISPLPPPPPLHFNLLWLINSLLNKGCGCRRDKEESLSCSAVCSQRKTWSETRPPASRHRDYGLMTTEDYTEFQSYETSWNTLSGRYGMKNIKRYHDIQKGFFLYNDIRGRRNSLIDSCNNCNSSF